MKTLQENVSSDDATNMHSMAIALHGILNSSCSLDDARVIFDRIKTFAQRISFENCFRASIFDGLNSNSPTEKEKDMMEKAVYFSFALANFIDICCRNDCFDEGKSAFEYLSENKIDECFDERFAYYKNFSILTLIEYAAIKYFKNMDDSEANYQQKEETFNYLHSLYENHLVAVYTQQRH